jgi:16S rRNA (cytidine1402-2'-O)-methyltransferase
MTQTVTNLQAGLYLVATPIGHLGDISPRARLVLEQADRVAAEDTRHSKSMLQALGVRTKAPLVSLHAHNEAQQTDSLVEAIGRGLSIALISDAGTPAVSDPGSRLVAAAHRAGAMVTPVPGPSALTAALSVSGLEAPGGSPVCFWGFLPNRTKARRAHFQLLSKTPGLHTVFESPHRIHEALADASEVLGPKTTMFLAREMTKRFETIFQGTVAEVQSRLGSATAIDSKAARGEYVLLFRVEDRPASGALTQWGPGLWADELRAHVPAPALAKILSKAFGLEREVAYGLAIPPQKSQGDDGPTP